MMENIHWPHSDPTSLLIGHSTSQSELTSLFLIGRGVISQRNSTALTQSADTKHTVRLICAGIFYNRRFRHNKKNKKIIVFLSHNSEFSLFFIPWQKHCSCFINWIHSQNATGKQTYSWVCDLESIACEFWAFFKPSRDDVLLLMMWTCASEHQSQWWGESGRCWSDRWKSLQEWKWGDHVTRVFPLYRPENYLPQADHHSVQRRTSGMNAGDDDQGMWWSEASSAGWAVFEQRNTHISDRLIWGL